MLAEKFELTAGLSPSGNPTIGLEKAKLTR
jgi:hypothetical protein